MSRCKIAVLIVCLLVCSMTAFGQSRCTMQNLAGDYAYMSTGSSTIINAPAVDPIHWPALYAPVTIMGKYTITPDGAMKGNAWAILGAVNMGLNAGSFEGKVILRDNCSGTVEYRTLPDNDLHIEDFFVLDHGQEIRSAAVQTPTPPVTWVTTAHRINGSCGQQKVQGSYLLDCRNLLQLAPGSPTFAGAFLMKMQISPGGNFTTRIYGKVGPFAQRGEAELTGNITVNQDCSAEGVLNAAPGTFNFAKGMFYDEGKRGFWLPLQNQLPDGSTSPQPYAACTLTQINP